MPFFWSAGKPLGKGAIALVDAPQPLRAATKNDTKEPRITETPLDAAAESTNKNSRRQPDLFGFSPFRHITTTYRIRSSRKKAKPRVNRREYGLLPGNDQGRDDKDVDDDSSSSSAYSDTYFIDEDTLVSQDQHGRTRRRCWLTCGMVFITTVLVTLLVLVVLLFRPHPIYGASLSHDSPNAGLDGPVTESIPSYPTDFLKDVVPIPCHSHNDYWRKVPLFSALHAGCIGTEADVWLRKDDLYVGHDRTSLRKSRTFRSLYVDPLVKILEAANQNTTFASSSSSSSVNGVFGLRPNQTLSLLVDVKTAGAATFRKVLEQVEPLRERGFLSTFEDGQVKYGPVTLVGSGNTPFDVVVENGTYRYAFFDAPLQSLEDSPYNSTNSYYASVALRRGLGIVWFGWFRQSQLQTMQPQLDEAHARSLKARYWSLPSWPIRVRNAVWTTLVEAGVDLLNVDDIDAAARGDWTKPEWN